MPLISPNFSIQELTATTKVGADGKPLGNTPGPIETQNLRFLAWVGLEPARAALNGCPLAITSGFRSKLVNEAAGGSPVSAHLAGLACDFVPLGLGLEIAFRRLVLSGIPFDQLILEHKGDKRWIHIALAPLFIEPRREALTTNDGVRYAAYTINEGGVA